MYQWIFFKKKEKKKTKYSTSDGNMFKQKCSPENDSESSHSHNYSVGELIPVQRGLKKRINWPRISSRGCIPSTQLHSKQCIMILFSQ